MMRLFVAMALVCTFLSACGVVTEQSIYEGIRSNERTKSAGVPPAGQPLPNYDQYQKDRDVLNK